MKIFSQEIQGLVICEIKMDGCDGDISIPYSMDVRIFFMLHMELTATKPVVSFPLRVVNFLNSIVGPALEALLDRLRSTIDVVLPGSAPVRLGISIGVATCNDATSSLDALMRQADEAMYQVKEINHQARSAA